MGGLFTLFPTFYPFSAPLTFQNSVSVKAELALAGRRSWVSGLPRPCWFADIMNTHKGD